MLRLALPTCATLPAWEVDDAPLHAALLDRRVELSRPVWDDPAVDWSVFDAVLIRTTWDYVPKRAAFVAWAERVGEVTRLFNPPEVIRANTHKSYLRQLEARGVRIAPTLWLEPGQPLPRGELRARGWERAFLKPAVGATASGTLRFACDTGGLAQADAHLRRHGADVLFLLQPYLASVETEGERSAIYVDGQRTHGVVKRPVAGDYRVQDDFGASDAPWELTPAEDALCAATLAACPPDLLYARVDWLTGADGQPCVNEVELVEPSLFLRHAPSAAVRLAERLIARARA